MCNHWDLKLSHSGPGNIYQKASSWRWRRVSSVPTHFTMDKVFVHSSCLWYTNWYLSSSSLRSLPFRSIRPRPVAQTPNVEVIPSGLAGSCLMPNSLPRHTNANLRDQNDGVARSWGHKLVVHSLQRPTVSHKTKEMQIEGVSLTRNLRR